MRDVVTDLRAYAADMGKGYRTRVILAEDNHRLRGLFASRLRQEGHEVLEARDGVELLELISTEIVYPRGGSSIDLVISNMHMPGATGLWVLASLRLLDWATPFVLLTAQLDSQLAAEAERLGALAVLTKPLSPHRLVQLVEEIVGGAEPELRVAAG